MCYSVLPTFVLPVCDKSRAPGREQRQGQRDGFLSQTQTQTYVPSTYAHLRVLSSAIMFAPRRILIQTRCHDKQWLSCCESYRSILLVCFCVSIIDTGSVKQILCALLQKREGHHCILILSSIEKQEALLFILFSMANLFDLHRHFLESHVLENT